MEKASSMVSFLFTFLLATTVVYTRGQEPVRDIAGKPVLIGEQYFIQPAFTYGGGLVPAAVNILPFCPLGITQTLLSSQPGLPVTFQYQSLTTLKFLSSKYPVSITFESNIWPFCNDFSKTWKTDSASPAVKEPPILIGGDFVSDENVGFVVQKAGRRAASNIYKFSVQKNPNTGMVGTIPSVWLGAPQLVLTNDTSKTLVVRFKKVEKLSGLKMFPSY